MKLPDMLNLINPAVRAQKPYHLEPRAVSIKLNQNENPFDWPLAIKEDVARFCIERPWNRYPPFIPDKLKELLGAYISVAPDQVIVGNGSNEMLLVLMLALVKPEQPVILCQPTFTVYRLLAEGLGAKSETVYLDRNLQFDVPALLAASKKNTTSLLILCSPNNPTGSTLQEVDLRAILAQHGGVCIVDQAYVEFGGFDAVALIDEYPNLIVTRTFSKALAGAGLRMGYMVGATEVIAEINKIKLPYNVNFFSDHVAQVVLQHWHELLDGIDVIKRERDDLGTFLAALPLTVFPSAANFILIKTVKKQELFDALIADGILVRDVASYPMLEHCLRISIGTQAENEALKQSLKKFFRIPH